MTIDDIRSEFKKKVCDEIDLFTEGRGRFIVQTPFLFDDGDHLKIVLKHDQNRNWFLTDEGHTFMHLSYEEIDLETKTRQGIIDRTLVTYNITNRDGELVILLQDNNFGDTLFSFIQGLLHISDVTYLKREMVRSAFYDEFKNLVTSKVPEKLINFDYNDPIHDPNSLYPVDCCIQTKPINVFIFAVQNDNKCRDATIAILQFEKFGIEFRPAAIFENQEEINRKVLARFSDVCDKQFSSISSAKERWDRHMKMEIEVT
ncbi:MAG: DUF1828 domain-containing protein [Candidatus Thermoplasmatota archaeon]|nr:DUF1828 domain-containing protein [Candidatus Thermoplasmatota archaeon]